MIKLIIVLLLTLVYSVANSSSDKISIKFEINDDAYNIAEVCSFVGAKSVRMYNLQFKSTDFITSSIDLIKNGYVTLKTDYGEISHLAGELRNSVLSVAVDEKVFKKIYNLSTSLTVNLSPYLIRQEELKAKYLVEIYFGPKFSGKNYDPKGVAYIYNDAFPYIKVEINHEELDQYLENCDNQQEKALSERKINIQKLTQAAKSGDPEAQTNLAKNYFLGDLVLRDYNQGMKWLKSAANSGYPRAQFLLGMAYTQGALGTDKNLKKAKIWIKKAHENGDPQAQEKWNELELWKY